MPKPNFVHLHVHSHYSLLDGLGKVPQLINKAVELGMPALALTDHGVMYGAIEFFLESKKAGIKPIIGQEAYIAPRGMQDKSAGVDGKPYHLVLLAKNLQGYKNLIKITSAAHLEGYYYRPRVDQDFLSRHSEGLIASSACLASETSRRILEKDFTGAEKVINTYKEIFADDSYYLELQHHPSIAEQQVVNEHIKRLSKKLNVPLIATNDTHYVERTDNVSHDMLVCIQTGKLVSDSNRMVYTGDFSLKSPAEMAEAFNDVPEAIENTLKIAELVNLDIPLGQSLLPNFPLPKNETEESLLKKWCEEGLKKRYREITPEIRTRLKFELETVFSMGYPGYFLIVADLVRFAKSKGIVVGPGRGSAAGSLISYAIGVTDVDPLKYDLLFERFLDPSRINMPDIDMDFEDVRRFEVIDYVRSKYGDDHVAGIITFGTIMARAAVRDVGRVLGVPYANVDKIAKIIPVPTQGRHVPLTKSVADNPELNTIYTQDPEAKQVIDAAARLEGTIRHASQHACAIVISREPLEEYAPVQSSQGGDVHQITQFSMDPIEKIGLLKMDFLGLSNLTTIRQACEIIEAVHGAKVDIYNIPLDDKKTFQLFGRGETTGVFQLESSGMKRYIKELKPNQFEDIVAMVALYRPGPMQWIDSFIKRKHGKEKIEYLHPLATEALKSTYGIPVYQEQVMRLSKDMCGFTGSEADTLRKAIGKKIPKLMAQIKEKFITGAVNNGVEKTQASKIWQQLEEFAAYCFNKSHAVCYALIAYQTAYLKAHYPDCFMAALMTSDLDNIDRLAIEISECEHLGLHVLPPDVNESFADFAVVKETNSVRFGLSAIKNVGSMVAKSIVRERKTNGSYQSLEEFLSRNATTLNKKVLESLVKTGALDRFAKRCNLFAALELITKFVGGTNKNSSIDQMSIFTAQSKDAGLPKLELPRVEEDSAIYLTWEKELLGLYLSDHPLKRFSDILIGKAEPIISITTEKVNSTVRVAGVVHNLKKIVTKSNAQMAFVELEDLTGLLEVVVFPSVYVQYQTLWQTDTMILVEGRINDKDGSVKILAEKVWPLESVGNLQLPPINQNYSNGSGSYPRKNWQPEQPKVAPSPQKYVVELPSSVTKQVIAKLKDVLQKSVGEIPVELHFVTKGEAKVLTTKLRVKPSSALNEAIRAVLN